MSHEEMSFAELMELEGRLRTAEGAGAPDAERNLAMARVRRAVQAHAAAHPHRHPRRWSGPLSIFAIVAIPAAAAAAIAAVALLHGTPLKAIVPVPATTPTGVSSPPATASPSAPTSASPVAIASCRLPVSGIARDPIGRPDGGFLTYPGGTLTVDPASEVVKVNDLIYAVKKRPELRGASFAPSYDLAMHQWLPVEFDAISPDGRQYAWVDSSKAFSSQGGPIIQPVHITDVGSGRDRVVNSDRDWAQPVWDSADAIYLVRHATQSDVSIGLWRLNPATGVATMINEDGLNWRNIGHGSAWGERLNLADPHPPASKNPANTAVRLDLATGALTDWMYRPGKYVQAIGTNAAGEPLVTVSTGDGTGAGNELWALTAPETGHRLTGAGNTIGYNIARADGSVMWLQGISPDFEVRIDRLDAAGGITQVSKFKGAAPLPTGGCH